MIHIQEKYDGCGPVCHLKKNPAPASRQNVTIKATASPQ